MSADRGSALDLLRDRAASIPQRIRALGDDPIMGLDTAGARAVVTTGVGSSGAHARALAAWLADLGVAARFLPPSAFPEAHRDPHADELLIVFSQGLSPNIRWALSEVDAWRQLAVVTSTHTSDADDRGRFAAALSEAGALLIDSGAEAEYGTLVRLAGPATGFWVVQQILRTFGADAGPDADETATAIEAARRRGEALAEPIAARLAREPVLWLAAGTTVLAADNLRLKWAEGLLRPVPPVADLLDFAHGPFQTLYDRDALLVALCHLDGSTHAAEARVRELTVPGRHAFVPLEARLEGPAAMLEYEAMANAMLLAALKSSEIHPGRWPGQGGDRALYSFGEAVRVVARGADAPSALATSTWCDLEGALGAGRRTAILPLGSTEQHGPHLPFATDTWIAEALAARLAARVDEAVVLPAVSLGAASEHMAFPGTLSLSEETLTELLCDVARSLARHGFERIFCFSAHGGNLGALRRADARLAEAASPADWRAFKDHSAVSAAIGRVAASDGISLGEAGQHAGELETSILHAIRPGSVRTRELGRGLVDPSVPAGELFYPDLRVHAKDGVVGDPRPALRERGERYLAAWTDVLAEAFDRCWSQNRTSTNGTVNA